MKDMIKKYLPYTVIIFIIYLVVPLIFRSGALASFVGIAWYFIFPVTAAASAAVYCSKYGLDFLFSLIAPIFFLPSMFLFYGGVNLTNIILLVVYLVAGMFGLFIGDMALGDKRKEREEQEKAEAEEMMLEAKRRDEREIKRIERREAAANRQNAQQRRNPRRPAQQNRNSTARQNTPRRAPSTSAARPTRRPADYDDFDYDKYLSDIDRKPKNSNEAEIDAILNEFGH